MEEATSTIGRTTDTRAAWRTVLILGLLTWLSYLDRNALNLLIGPIRHDLQINDTKASLLLGLSFAILFSLAGLPAGYLIDRVNRRNLVFGSVLIWSGMTVLSGMSRSFGMLFLGRTGVGMGEASLSPASASMIRDLFPIRLRGRAIAILMVASTTGGGVALLAVGSLTQVIPADGLELPALGHVHSWQAVLMLLGVAGFPLALSLLLVREPRRATEATANSDRDLIGFGRHLRQTHSIYLPLFIGQGLTGIGSFGFAAWMPTAIRRRWTIPLDQIGITYGAMQIAGALTGLLLIALLLDRATVRYGARLIPIVLAITTAGAGLAAALAPIMPTTALTWLAVSLHWMMIAPTAVAAWSTTAVIAPSRAIGKVTAISYLCMNLFGYGLGPTLIAYVSDGWLGGGAAIGSGITAISGAALLFAAIANSFLVRNFAYASARRHAGA